MHRNSDHEQLCSGTCLWGGTAGSVRGSCSFTCSNSCFMRRCFYFTGFNSFCLVGIWVCAYRWLFWFQARGSGMRKMSRLIWSVVFFAVSFISALITSIKNPRDPLISLSPEERQRRIDVETLECKKCRICESEVFKQSLHCRYCNKCVLRLDHHCFFLNTCIGRRNYRYFALSIGFGGVFFTLSAAISWYTFALYFVQRNYFTDTLRYIFGVAADSDPNWLYILFVCFICILAVFQSFFGFFLMDLTRFHILLYHKGMSTLEYARSMKAQMASQASEQARRSLTNILPKRNKVAPEPLPPLSVNTGEGSSKSNEKGTMTTEPNSPVENDMKPLKKWE